MPISVPSLTKVVILAEGMCVPRIPSASIAPHAFVNQSRHECLNREHRAIYDVIAAQEPETTARLAVYHSQALRERLASVFTRSDDTPAVEIRPSAASR